MCHVISWLLPWEIYTNFIDNSCWASESDWKAVFWRCPEWSIVGGWYGARGGGGGARGRVTWFTPPSVSSPTDRGKPTYPCRATYRLQVQPSSQPQWPQLKGTLYEIIKFLKSCSGILISPQNVEEVSVIKKALWNITLQKHIKRILKFTILYYPHI